MSKDSTELGKPNTEGRCQARLPSRRVFGWREERGAASATPLAQLGPFLPLRLSAQVPAAAGRSPRGVRSPSWGASLPWPRGQGCLVLVLNGLGARRAMVLSFLGGLWDGDGDGGMGGRSQSGFPYEVFSRCGALRCSPKGATFLGICGAGLGAVGQCQGRGRRGEQRAGTPSLHQKGGAPTLPPAPAGGSLCPPAAPAPCGPAARGLLL